MSRQQISRNLCTLPILIFLNSPPLFFAQGMPLQNPRIVLKYRNFARTMVCLRYQNDLMSGCYRNHDSTVSSILSNFYWIFPYVYLVFEYQQESTIHASLVKSGLSDGWRRFWHFSWLRNLSKVYKNAVITHVSWNTHGGFFEWHRSQIMDSYALLSECWTVVDTIATW